MGSRAIVEAFTTLTVTHTGKSSAKATGKGWEMLHLFEEDHSIFSSTTHAREACFTVTAPGTRQTFLTLIKGSGRGISTIGVAERSTDRHTRSS